MPRRFEHFSNLFSSLKRVKATVTDDANPQVIYALADAKTGKPAGNTCSTTGTTSKLTDASTWSSNNLKGAMVFIMGGTNGHTAGNPEHLIPFSFIDNSDNDNIYTQKTFDAAFDNTSKYIVEPVGIRLDPLQKLAVVLKASGGSDGEVITNISVYDRTLDMFTKIKTVAAYTSGTWEFGDLPTNLELVVWFTGIAVSITELTAVIKGVKR